MKLMDLVGDRGVGIRLRDIVGFKPERVAQDYLRLSVPDEMLFDIYEVALPIKHKNRKPKKGAVPKFYCPDIEGD